jgi:hypothetical protein
MTTTKDTSEIRTSKSSVTYSGSDAVELFRAATLRSALGLLQKGIMPTRGLNMTKALGLAERYTGRKYKRTESAAAIRDITVWIETMKSAIPVVDADQQRHEERGRERAAAEGRLRKED